MKISASVSKYLRNFAVGALAYASLYCAGRANYSFIFNDVSSVHSKQIVYDADYFYDGLQSLVGRFDNRRLPQTGNRTLSVDVIVSDSVSRISDWTDYVGGCLEAGFSKVGEVGGVNFSLDSFGGVNDGDLYASFAQSKSVTSALSSKFAINNSADIVVYFRAGPVGFVEEEFLGHFTGSFQRDDSFIWVNLTSSRDVNVAGFCHKLGHLFGARHSVSKSRNYLKFHFLSIPSFGFLGGGDIMEPYVNVLAPQQYFSESSVSQIRKRQK